MTLSRRTTWWTALLVVLAMALPAVAQAQETTDETTDEQVTEVPEAASVLATLPVLGSGLNLTIDRNEDGTIASVTLDPSDGTTVEMEEDNKIVILLADGDTELAVKSEDDKVQTKVTADDPADVSGDGVWTGDVFGTGEVSIPYSVSFDGNVPTITVGAVTAPADVTSALTEPEAKASDTGDASSYAIGVQLTSGENQAKVTLATRTKVNEDGETIVVVIVNLIYRDQVEEPSEPEEPKDEEADEPTDDQSEARSVRVSDEQGDERKSDRDDRDVRGDS